MPFPQLDKCELCGSASPLARSHILPASAYRSIMSLPGSFYDALRPRLKKQGGTWAHLLCHACEVKLSFHEREFQRMLFPKDKPPSLPITYNSSLYICCCSISWRVLTYLKLSEPDNYAEKSRISLMLSSQIPEEQHSMTESVRIKWSETILTGEPKDEDHHLIFLNGKNVPFERSDIIGFSLFQDGKNLALASILGPIIVLGFVKQGSGWSNTTISPRGSTFAIGAQSLPVGFFRWLHDLYFNIERVAR